jgi:hypothetical protein
VVLVRAFGSPARVGNAGSSGSAMWCYDLGARISSSLEIGVNGDETGSAASGGAACDERIKDGEEKKIKEKKENGRSRSTCENNFLNFQTPISNV